MSQVGSAGKNYANPLYSEMKKVIFFLDETKNINTKKAKITKQSHAFIGYLWTTEKRY